MIIVHKQNGKEQTISQDGWDKMNASLKEMYSIKSQGTASLPEAKEVAKETTSAKKETVKKPESKKDTEKKETKK